MGGGVEDRENCFISFTVLRFPNYRRHLYDDRKAQPKYDLLTILFRNLFSPLPPKVDFLNYRITVPGVAHFGKF